MKAPLAIALLAAAALAPFVPGPVSLGEGKGRKTGRPVIPPSREMMALLEDSAKAAEEAEPAEKPAKQEMPKEKKKALEVKEAKKSAPAASRKPPAVTRKGPLPRTVPLPEAGERPASDLFAIAEKLHGTPVVPEEPGVAKARVLITPRLAGQPVTREELAILLGASGLYLFPKEEKESRVLVATRNVNWTPEAPAPAAPRFFRKFSLRPSSFESVRKEVEAYIEKKNREVPAEDGAPPAALAADPRTSSIIVRASSPRVLAGVEEIVRRAGLAEPDTVHLHTYSPRNRRAAELEEALLESLSESQRGKVTVVILRGKNILLIRAPDAIYEELEETLSRLDTRGRKQKGAAGKGE